MEAPAVSSSIASSKSSRCDGVEELGQAAEVELVPAGARAHDGGLLDQVAAHCLPAPAGVEVRERVLEVHGPQRAFEVAPEPVVEAKGVEVRRRADLEHDAAGSARVRRACRDQVQPVPLGVVPLEVPLGLERPAFERGPGVALEGADVGVVAQAEEDASRRGSSA